MGVTVLLLFVYPRTAATLFAAFNCDEFEVRCLSGGGGRATENPIGPNERRPR